MLLLDIAHHLKQRRDLIETLGLCFFCKALVHIRPLIVLAGCTVKQVFHGAGDFAAVKLLKPDLGMFLLIVRRHLEDICNLLIAVLFRLGSVVSVFIARLRFTCERCHQVRLCLAAFKFHRDASLK